MLRNKIIFISMAVTIGMGLVYPAFNTKIASAQTAEDQILSGIDEACANASCASEDTKIGDTVTAVINILSLVVGLIAVVMIIVAGIRYVTSGGESGSVASAKNTIIYAIIGIIIVALSQVIVRFVVNRSTTDPVTPSETPGTTRIIRS